ncbi:MAG: EF-P 5-aminopentanol modification-associated protein YfmH [Coprobacillus cateniformis]
METINYQTLQETLYYEEMANGLKVYLLPKKGFSKTYGLFSTHFGSVDTTFVPLGENEMITVPDGIAHFLEHKMFEMQDGDASEKFAQLGASTNAFTSSSRTAYLFNTTSHENECVELLLDFVQDIYLTDQTVEKEKGIINQEIGMYDDDPDWRCYFGSIQNLYQKHPVKIDIAGTVETVNEIDKDILEKCYQTFYHPSNMMLFVVGNIQVEDTIQLIRNNQAKKHFDKEKQIQREITKEPQGIDKKEDILHMDVIMPKVIVSMKINDILSEPKEKLKRELGMNILLDLLFSKSSPLFEEWTRLELLMIVLVLILPKKEIILSCKLWRHYGTRKLRDKILDLIHSIKDYAIDDVEFQRVQKKNIGVLIGVFNSPEGIANLFSRYYFEGIMIFDLIDCVATLKKEDIENLKALFDIDLTSTCMVKAK